MSNYHFGLYLDGCFSPESIRANGNTVWGPLSLLDHLETAMGIPPPKSSILKRILAYRNAMEEVSEEQDFYAKSFDVDPLATAQLVLAYRDELCEAGWTNQDQNPNAPERVASLARIEPVFANSGLAHSCPAGRIKAVLEEVRLCSPKIGKITVTDPAEILPQCWVTLLTELGAEFVKSAPSKVIAKRGTVLEFLQSNLSKAPGKSPADQTVKVITAATREKAAHALATELANLPGANTVLIADDGEQARLNDYMFRSDLPRPSATNLSAHSLLQLPLLYLRMRNKRLDPQACLEFFLHPASPVPHVLGKAMARTIDNNPGYGNHWKETLEKVAEEQEPDFKVRLEDTYSQWIERSELIPDLPTGSDIARVLQPLAGWIDRKARAKSTAQPEVWLTASHAIRDLITTIDSEKSILPDEFDHLVSKWLASAATGAKFAGEVGAVTHIAAPDLLLEPSDHIVWWCPPPAVSESAPWSPDELVWFEQSGIKIIDPKDKALAHDEITSRAVFMAKKSLTIFHVTRDGGKSTQRAGILTRIESCCGDEVEADAVSCIKMESTDTRLLPQKRRWWKFSDAGLFPPRPQESFSSLNKVVHTPYMWTLDYHARVKPGPLFQYRVKESPLRKGSLLHHLAENIFDPACNIDWKNADENTLHAEIDNQLAMLFETEAAYYLMPGLEAARIQLTYNAKKTLWKLVSILREAEVDTVAMEEKKGPIAFIGGTELGGRIDLIARRADNEAAVVDLKLGAKTKRHGELASNTHLQLAIYGQLMLESEATNAATAFFILNNGGALLTRNENFFPGVNQVIAKKDSPSGDWQACWSEFEEVYQWRRTQLDQGKIEITIEDTNPYEDPEESHPIKRWEPGKDASSYSIYDALTGWNPED